MMNQDYQSLLEHVYRDGGRDPSKDRKIILRTYITSGVLGKQTVSDLICNQLHFQLLDCHPTAKLQSCISYTVFSFGIGM